MTNEIQTAAPVSIEALERYANTESLSQGQADRLRDLIATLRKTLAQQEAVAWLVDHPKYPGMRLWSDGVGAKEYAAHCGIQAQPLYPAPVAHSPAGVDEAMVERAIKAHATVPHDYQHEADYRSYQRDAMRASLTAALNPAPSEVSP